MRVLHISDVHVQVDYAERPWTRLGWRRVMAQAEYRLLRRARRYARATETLQRIASEALQRGVDHVVLSGDLTGVALDEEFQGVHRALGRLAEDRSRITVVPGNHDVFTPGSHRKRRFERWFGHLLDSDVPEARAEGAWPIVRLVGDSLAIVGLNSARVPPMPGIAGGLVGEDQLAALVKLAQHPKVRGRAIYAVLHHAPLRRDGSRDRPLHGLADFERLLEACRVAGVAAVLCGHLHVRFHLPLAGGPSIVCGGSSTWLGHEGFMLLEDRAGKLASVEEVALGAPAPAPEERAAAEPVPAEPVVRGPAVGATG